MGMRAGQREDQEQTRKQQRVFSWLSIVMLAATLAWSVTPHGEVVVKQAWATCQIEFSIVGRTCRHFIELYVQRHGLLYALFKIAGTLLFLSGFFCKRRFPFWFGLIKIAFASGFFACFYWGVDPYAMPFLLCMGLIRWQLSVGMALKYMFPEKPKRGLIYPRYPLWS